MANNKKLVSVFTDFVAFQFSNTLNRKAGKYPASLCNGVDESDRT